MRSNGNKMRSQTMLCCAFLLPSLVSLGVSVEGIRCKLPPCELCAFEMDDQDGVRDLLRKAGHATQ